MMRAFAGLLVACLLSVGQTSLAVGNHQSNLGPGILGGEYWPWGKEVNFPWKNMQGVWVAVDKFGHKSYFSFTVLNNSAEKILKVQEFDNDSCQILGRGIGYEQNRVVTGRFTGLMGDYDVRIHVFKECDVIKESGARTKDSQHDLTSVKMVPVMAISPAGSPGLAKVFPIYRVNPNPNIICE